ncbi:MAG: restriction endonuclease [Chloroflexi bacterium]|nr:restriction endonuclease [Chloroflexota bacterium]
MTQLLTATLQYQSNSFCPLLVELIRKGIMYRQNKGDSITYEEMKKLNELIAQVGFKIPELHDLKFLGSLPRSPSESDGMSDAVALSHKVRLELSTKLLKLSSLSPQERGFEFEKFLNDLFHVFNLAPRSSFRLVGEQIDGSLQFQDETYLVEATWQNELVGQERLLVFSGKVGGKAKWSRGLFMSYSGFSSEGLEAFIRGKPTNIVCMDGLDLNDLLQSKLSLRTVLEQKVRRAAETNEAYVSVRQLFSNVS